MEKIRNTLGVSKGDDMSGIDVDQSALLQDEQFAEEANNPETSLDKGANPKDINSAGGPSFGRESKVPDHKSELLNKLDPRIGFTPEEADANLLKYESKYGKPKNGSKEGKDGLASNMSGIGGDQSALMQNEQFAKQANSPYHSTSVEVAPQDSEGYS